MLSILLVRSLGKLRLLRRHRGIRPPVKLRPALEAVIRLCSGEQRVTIHADLLLRDDVFLFLIKALSREESVLVNVVLDLAQYTLSQFLDQGESLLTDLDVTQVLRIVLHFLDGQRIVVNLSRVG